MDRFSNVPRHQGVTTETGKRRISFEDASIRWYQFDQLNRERAKGQRPRRTTLSVLRWDGAVGVAIKLNDGLMLTSLANATHVQTTRTTWNRNLFYTVPAQANYVDFY